MAYIDPKDVISPQTAISRLQPVFDSGEWEFSVALLHWERTPSVGIRWNGGTKEEGRRGLSPGTPQSRGLPTWFVLPEVVAVPVLQTLLDQRLVGGGSIDKSTAEQAIQRAIEDRTKEPASLRQVATQADDVNLEEKVLAILMKLKAEGRM
jgi:hypothetical protein